MHCRTPLASVSIHHLSHLSYRLELPTAPEKYPPAAARALLPAIHLTALPEKLRAISRGATKYFQGLSTISSSHQAEKWSNLCCSLVCGVVDPLLLMGVCFDFRLLPRRALRSLSRFCQDMTELPTEPARLTNPSRQFSHSPQLHSIITESG